jgi:outer membrane protein assembly factor BamB
MRTSAALALLALSGLVSCGGDDASSGPTSGDAGSPPSDATAGDAPGNPKMDAGPPLDAGRDAAPPACASDAWSTYGHDAQRTFASGGCPSPSATVKWRYTPTAPSGRTFEAVFRAVAESDGAYLGWMASDAPYTGTSALDRIDAAGAKVWTWDSGTDTNLGNWPTIAGMYVAVEDDGLYLLDPHAGTVLHGAGVDWWGQTIADSSRLYVVNQMQADGPGLFVGAVDDTTKVLWRQNLHQACGQSWGDVLGGIALDGGALFYAPEYMASVDGGAPPVSGVYAFDAAAGTPRWNHAASPRSAISASSGLVYLIEDPGTLVARKESDGTVQWSRSLAGDAAFAEVGAQAPVLADGLAIVATSSGIVAVDAATGAMRWTSSVVAPAYSFPSVITNGCGGAIPSGGARETTMVAALASAALVVTASTGIEFVSLADGRSLGAITLDAGPGGVHDPIVVGSRLYVVDATGLVALE